MSSNVSAVDLPVFPLILTRRLDGLDFLGRIPTPIFPMYARMEGITGVALNAARLLSVLSSSFRVEVVLNNCRLTLNIRRFG